MTRRRTPGPLSRRDLLKSLALAGISAPLGLLPSRAWASEAAATGSRSRIPPSLTIQAPPSTPAPARYILTPGDDAFLEDLERANFLYFWEQTNPETGW